VLLLDAVVVGFLLHVGLGFLHGFQHWNLLLGFL
jgi:hypothetical protein